MKKKKFVEKFFRTLDEFRPDLFLYYGGGTLEFYLSEVAKERHIPVFFFLCNANYHSNHWAKHVSCILTDSKTTAKLYKERNNLVTYPVGTFINKEKILADTHLRKNVLLVNSGVHKGVAFFIATALYCEKRYPEIIFEIIDTYGIWQITVESITKALGEKRSNISNIIVTPNLADMRGPYGRARLLMAPSLCEESMGRVVIEAMMNGIPVIASKRGGLPEVIDSAGYLIDIMECFFEKPYVRCPSEEQIKPIASFIRQMYTDEKLYQEYVQRALLQAENFTIDKATDTFLNIVKNFTLES